MPGMASGFPHRFLHGVGQLIGQCHFLALVMVFEQMAQRVNRVEQDQHRLAPRTFAVQCTLRHRVHAHAVGIRKLCDAQVLEAIDLRGPAGVVGYVRQQPLLFDVDVTCQLQAPAPQTLACGAQTRQARRR